MEIRTQQELEREQVTKLLRQAKGGSLNILLGLLALLPLAAVGINIAQTRLPAPIVLLLMFLVSVAVILTNARLDALLQLLQGSGILSQVTQGTVPQGRASDQA